MALSTEDFIQNFDPLEVLWPHISKRIAPTSIRRMACSGIQGFTVYSLLLMPQSSSVTTESSMYLGITTAVIWVQLSMNFCLNY